MPTVCEALPCVPRACGVLRAKDLLTLVTQQDQVSLVMPCRPLVLLTFCFLPNSLELLLLEGGRTEERQRQTEGVRGEGGVSPVAGVSVLASPGCVVAPFGGQLLCVPAPVW